MIHAKKSFCTMFGQSILNYFNLQIGLPNGLVSTNETIIFKNKTMLKIKESFHIEQLNPELNKQVEHVSLSLHF